MVIINLEYLDGFFALIENRKNEQVDRFGRSFEPDSNPHNYFNRVYGSNGEFQQAITKYVLKTKYANE